MLNAATVTSPDDCIMTAFVCLSKHRVLLVITECVGLAFYIKGQRCG